MKLVNAFFLLFLVTFTLTSMERPFSDKRSFSDNYIATFTPEEYEHYKAARELAATIIFLLGDYCEKKQIIDQQEWLPNAEKLQTSDGLFIKRFFPYHGIATKFGFYTPFLCEADISEKKIGEFNEKLAEKYIITVNKDDLYASITKRDVVVEAHFRPCYAFIPQKVAEAKWRTMTKKYEEIDVSPRSPRKRIINKNE